MVNYEHDEVSRILAHSFAELSIQNAVWSAEWLPLPEEALLVQFNTIAKEVITKISTNNDCHRRYVVTFFGAPTPL